MNEDHILIKRHIKYSIFGQRKPVCVCWGADLRGLLMNGLEYC